MFLYILYIEKIVFRVAWQLVFVKDLDILFSWSNRLSRLDGWDIVIDPSYSDIVSMTGDNSCDFSQSCRYPVGKKMSSKFLGLPDFSKEPDEP